MRSVRIHGVLLVLAAAWALQTFTRERSLAVDRDRVAVWSYDTTWVEGIRYETTARAIEVTRRTADGESFLWGVESAVDADTLRFPLGLPGDKLVADFATLRVLRDLGPVTGDRLADLGLDDPQGRIRIALRGEVRELTAGDTPYGGSDRYVLDEATGHAYVIPSDVIRPLEIGYGALRERRLHAFAATDVAAVLVRAGPEERRMQRLAGDALSAGWTPLDSPDQPDVEFADFMDRVGQLAISGFERTPPREVLEPLLRIDYLASDGRMLGYTELLRASRAQGAEFYVMSERTRIPAGAVASLADRVRQDLGTIF